MSAKRFNLSALAVRERSITLFLIILITIAGIYSFFWPWASGRSALYGQTDDHYQRLARGDRAGNSGSGCRAAGKTSAGAQMV